MDEKKNKFGISDKERIIRNVYSLPNSELSLGAKAVYLALVFCSDRKTGKSWPSHQYLADETGLVRRSVIKRLKELESKNIIKIRSRRGKKIGASYQTSVYQIQFNYIKNLQPKCEPWVTFNPVINVSLRSHLTALQMCPDRSLNVNEQVAKCEPWVTLPSITKYYQVSMHATRARGEISENPQHTNENQNACKQAEPQKFLNSKTQNQSNRDEKFESLFEQVNSLFPRKFRKKLSELTLYASKPSWYDPQNDYPFLEYAWKTILQLHNPNNTDALMCAINEFIHHTDPNNENQRSLGIGALKKIFEDYLNGTKSIDYELIKEYSDENHNNENKENIIHMPKVVNADT